MVVADAEDGLNQPVAVAVAGGGFGGGLFVVNQGGNTLWRIDPTSGEGSEVVATSAWSVAPGLLTGVVWDSQHDFDGNLYVGDQGGDGDADSRIYRVTPAGETTIFAWRRETLGRSARTAASAARPMRFSPSFSGISRPSQRTKQISPPEGAGAGSSSICPENA